MEIKKIDLSKKSKEFFELWYQGYTRDFNYWWIFWHSAQKIAAFEAKVYFSCAGARIFLSNAIPSAANSPLDFRLDIVSSLLQDTIKDEPYKIVRDASMVVVQRSDGREVLTVEFTQGVIMLWVNPRTPFYFLMALRFSEAVRDYVPEPYDD